MDERLQRPPSPPRRQRACVACAKARARCNFKAENVRRHLCDRCEKMGIECLAKTTRGLRRPRQIRDTGREVADGNTMADGREELGNEVLPRMDELNSQLGNAPLDREPHSAGSRQVIQPPLTPTTISNPPLQQQPQRTSSPLPFGFTWPQASYILTIFQTHYQPNFPFISIPTGTTAKQLYASKPFLFRAIMLVATPLPTTKMKRNVLAYLSQQMFLEEVRTLEVLQGLLVVIAWAHNCHIGEEQVTNLVHLALGYAHTLGLTAAKARRISKNDQAAEEETGHSVEEQNALIGLYCLLSVNSTQHSRRNPLDTPYIETCLKTLTVNNQSPSILLISSIVQITQQSDSLTHSFSSPDLSPAKSYAYLLEGSGRTFRTAINRIIETAMHPDLQAHRAFFKLWQNYLFVRLYEPATRVKELESEGVGPSMYRSLCLRDCLQAIQDYFEILLTEPPTSILYGTALTLEQSGFVMLMAARILLIDAPDWDVKLVRQTLDLVSILDQIVQRLEEAENLRKQAAQKFAEEHGMLVPADELNAESKIAETSKKTRRLKEGFQASLEGRAHDVDLGETRSLETRGERPEQVHWVNGMLAGSAWTFDDFARGYMREQGSVTL